MLIALLETGPAGLYCDWLGSMYIICDDCTIGGSCLIGAGWASRSKILEYLSLLAINCWDWAAGSWYNEGWSCAGGTEYPAFWLCTLAATKELKAIELIFAFLAFLLLRMKKTITMMIQPPQRDPIIIPTSNPTFTL